MFISIKFLDSKYSAQNFAVLREKILVIKIFDRAQLMWLWSENRSSTTLYKIVHVLK